MEKGKLIDPVAGNQEEMEQDAQAIEEKSLDMDVLNVDDFQPIPITAARQPHPFEGYPQPQVKIGTELRKSKEVPKMLSKTWIVALNPKEYIHQDPSGKNVSITSGGKEKIINLKTYHNRVVRDQNGQSIDVVFDREITLAGGKVMQNVALCPDHTARAQIVYTVNKKSGKIEVDRRYVLADTGQVGRLRRVFEMFHYQQTKSERLAQKFDEEPESMAG